MAMALPLLPQHLFEEGRQVVRRWLLDGAEGVILEQSEQFYTYLRRQWGDLNVSVYGEEVRTNNAVESFHKSLVQLVGRAHPNIWMFITFIQNMEHSKACDLIRLQNGLQLPNRSRPSWRALSDRILTAQHNLLQNGDVSLFLRRMSHTVDNLEGSLNLDLSPQDILEVPAPPQAVAFAPLPVLSPPPLPAALPAPSPASVPAPAPVVVSFLTSKGTIL